MRLPRAAADPPRPRGNFARPALLAAALTAFAPVSAAAQEVAVHSIAVQSQPERATVGVSVRWERPEPGSSLWLFLMARSAAGRWEPLRIEPSGVRVDESLVLAGPAPACRADPDGVGVLCELSAGASGAASWILAVPLKAYPSPERLEIEAFGVPLRSRRHPATGAGSTDQ